MSGGYQKVYVRSPIGAGVQCMFNHVFRTNLICHRFEELSILLETYVPEKVDVHRRMRSVGERRSLFGKIELYSRFAIH